LNPRRGKKRAKERESVISLMGLKPRTVRLDWEKSARTEGEGEFTVLRYKNYRGAKEERD